MKYLLVTSASLLILHRALWLVMLLLGIWALWQRWRRVYDVDAVWLERAECMRSQAIIPKRTDDWEHTRLTCAYWYGAIGLISVGLGIRLLMIQPN